MSSTLAPNIVDFPYREDAEVLFMAIRDMPDPVWLDSGKPRSLQGRFDIISAAPLAGLQQSRSQASLTRGFTALAPDDQPFLAAQDLLNEIGAIDPDSTSLPFNGGLLGYFSYPLGESLQLDETARERGLFVTQKQLALPNLRLGLYTWALILNHQTHKAWLVFHPACEKALRQDVISRLNSIHEERSTRCSHSDFVLIEPFKASSTPDDYRARLKRILNYIEAGDCYQVNFAQHFSAKYTGDPWQAYRRLRAALPSPFSAYLGWGDQALLSLSPERFIKLSGRQAETRPIKGTTARGSTIEEDRVRAVALMNSAKDRAENLMIVDLLRNDLGKSCVPGSIRVPGLFQLQSFANVHHLVSTVTGTLSKDKSAFDLLNACFPGGSITGAPKKRAMEIIRELEPVERSVYCGSIGYISACGHMDSNIAIRTMAADGNQLHCWGGGGIVADSDIDSEYRESLTKIQLLMDTLAG
ncbi:MAG TPA: aminodeoxychorismate synthase component I [Porticoccaceae bacterium]|nr:aminodeoxychorismate synthase component I [Porticoccaceae bacterium]HCO58642.1 aminodeoxychorismate synthase component I [Porticoccaceae bacterium]